jgi:hypothetical protein
MHGRRTQRVDLEPKISVSAGCAEKEKEHRDDPGDPRCGTFSSGHRFPSRLRSHMIAGPPLRPSIDRPHFRLQCSNSQANIRPRGAMPAARVFVTDELQQPAEGAHCER